MADNGIQEQIDDLAVMSREYEKQEAVRMTGQSVTGNVNNDEPYINEIIPMNASRSRRRTMESDVRSGR